MPYLQLDGAQYPLVAGENAVGASAAALVRVADAGTADVAAILVVSLDGNTVIRLGPGNGKAGVSGGGGGGGGGGGVRVNGVQLGAEPTPLIHGDKIEIAGHELYFGDDRKGGNTQHFPAVRIPEAGSPAPAPAPVAGAGGAATGGRLVSLVDGREYHVGDEGLVIGRDPSCDVVVPAVAVSRRHATITSGVDGYILTDTSTNGVLVNGERVMSPAVLSRGDVVTVATEEFRFYADAAPSRAAAPHAAAAAQGAPARAVLATLEVVSTGVLHGKTFELGTPLAHVGRGAHNDVVIADESVSDTHAKLQRREAGWFVVDMESTNGTYVGGRRIAGEERLIGAPTVRFGGVKFIFRSAEHEAEEAAGGGRTRTIAALTPEQRAVSTAPTAVDQRQHPAPPAREPGARPASGGAPGSDEARSGGSRVVVWILLLAAVAAGAYLLLMRS
ncbi:MAG TPA: FHA domain-containing protein [Gemmatimonadaceae bacterium]